MMDASRRILRISALLTVLVLSLHTNAVVAATIKNSLKCSSGLIENDGQWEIGSVTLRLSEATKNEHTYTYPEKKNGEYRLWPIDKYGRLTKTKVKNVHELEFQTELFFNHDMTPTVCLVLRLTHFESGEPVINKNLKYRKYKFVQWAFVIGKDIHKADDPIILEVLFSETRPVYPEETVVIYTLEAFVPRSGGELELVVMEPVIALVVGK